jgi:cholesterol oxidase
MTGCRHNAKNTLDKNYLYLAQKLGVEILAEHEVIDVSEEQSGGYRVRIKKSTSFVSRKKEFRSTGIVFSGGVLGTVRLLLKLKDRSLPRLPESLGKNLRTNNETLVSVSSHKKDVDMSKGIAIGSIFHPDENTHLEICRYGKGSGFWKVVHLPLSQGRSIVHRSLAVFTRLLRSPFSYFKSYFINSWSKNTVVLLFMQTLDSTLSLKRGPFGFLFTNTESGPPPSSNIPESEQLTEDFVKEVKGQPSTFSLETLLGIPSTAHILGGAVMGKNQSEGVVDKNGKVFNYENMYVADGSIISANPGVNPSLSITAISEYIMDKIPFKGVQEGEERTIQKRKEQMKL